MKRFLLFVFWDYDTDKGGWNDFCGSFDDLDTARAEGEKIKYRMLTADKEMQIQAMGQYRQSNNVSFQVVDSQIEDIVEEG